MARQHNELVETTFEPNDTPPGIDDGEISSALSALGLSEPEVMVYRALVELGSRPAGIISQKTGFKRGHTYNLLATLLGKGLVQEFTKNNVRHFTCSPPKSLLSLLDIREQEINSHKGKLLRIIPHLEKLRSPLASQARVRFFQSIDGVKEIFEDMLREPGHDIYGLFDVAYSWTVHGDKFHEWRDNFIRRRTELGIWYYGILNKSPESDSTAIRPGVKYRKLKMIQGLTLPVEIHVYGSKVSMISTHAESVGLIIEHQGIAETLRNLHQAVWNILPEYNP